MEKTFSGTLIQLIKHTYYIYSGGLWGVWILVISKGFSDGGQFAIIASPAFAYLNEFIIGTFNAFLSSSIFVVTFILVSLNRTIDPVVLTVTSTAFFLMYVSSTTWVQLLGFSPGIYTSVLLVCVALLLNVILFKKKNPTSSKKKIKK